MRLSLNKKAGIASVFLSAALTHAALGQTQFTEVQATPTALGDVEFDFGRDGVPCPSCNFGDGNDRANWTDRDGNIWIAHLDPNTGLFVSPGAKDELADTTAFFWNVYGNGPEWAFSTQNGQVVSQLVYSRWKPGEPQTIGYTGAAFTTQTAYNANGQDNWQAAFFPDAIGKGVGSQGTNNSNLPEASQCNTDAVATAMWKNFADPTQVFIEAVSTAGGTTPTQLVLPTGVTSNGIGERFVPCTHQVLFQGTVEYKNSGVDVQQVFWYDFDTKVVEQLTSDPTAKNAGFMFQAPDSTTTIFSSRSPAVRPCKSMSRPAPTPTARRVSHRSTRSRRPIPMNPISIRSNRSSTVRRSARPIFSRRCRRRRNRRKASRCRTVWP